MRVWRTEWESPYQISARAVRAACRSALLRQRYLQLDPDRRSGSSDCFRPRSWKSMQRQRCRQPRAPKRARRPISPVEQRLGCHRLWSLCYIRARGQNSGDFVHERAICTSLLVASLTSPTMQAPALDVAMAPASNDQSSGLSVLVQSTPERGPL